MTLPFLDIARPGFSTKSREVMAARAASWCARTPFGFAVLRHRQAGQLLRDRRFRQGSHAWPDTVGLGGAFAEFWKRSLISREGDEHRELRRIAQAALSDEYILGLVPDFRRRAADLLGVLRNGGGFDFIECFSEPFAGRAITTLLALQDSEAEGIARDASALGLAMGFDAKTYEARSNAACERLSRMAAALIDRAESGEDRTGLVARLVAEARNSIDRQALIDLIVIAIFGGVDTTRAQLGFAMVLFERHPEQWEWLGAHPKAVPQAIEEVIRCYPTTTWATREALEDVEIDGARIPKGAILHIFVHATATDPLVAEHADFDICAKRKVHFGFGGGAHHCLGQFVARTDMAAALAEILPRWKSIRFASPPEFLPDSGNTSPARLRLDPVWVR